MVDRRGSRDRLRGNSADVRRSDVVRRVDRHAEVPVREIRCRREERRGGARDVVTVLRRVLAFRPLVFERDRRPAHPGSGRRTDEETDLRRVKSRRQRDRRKRGVHRSRAARDRGGRTGGRRDGVRPEAPTVRGRDDHLELVPHVHAGQVVGRPAGAHVDAEIRRLARGAAERRATCLQRRLLVRCEVRPGHDGTCRSDRVDPWVRARVRVEDPSRGRVGRSRFVLGRGIAVRQPRLRSASGRHAVDLVARGGRSVAVRLEDDSSASQGVGRSRVVRAARRDLRLSGAVGIHRPDRVRARRGLAGEGDPRAVGGPRRILVLGGAIRQVGD